MIVPPPQVDRADSMAGISSMLGLPLEAGVHVGVRAWRVSAEDGWVSARERVGGRRVRRVRVCVRGGIVRVLILSLMIFRAAFHVGFI